MSRPRLIERLNAGLHRKLTPMRSVGFIIRSGRLWQDHGIHRSSFQFLGLPACPGLRPDAPIPDQLAVNVPSIPAAKTVRAPLGRVFAARSGDKGGNANLGVWAKTGEAFAFLRQFLTTKKLCFISTFSDVDHDNATVSKAQS